VGRLCECCGQPLLPDGTCLEQAHEVTELLSLLNEWARYCNAPGAQSNEGFAAFRAKDIT